MSLKHYGGILQWAGRRFWESRQFYSAYIALFVAITNWITIQYRLLLENVPVLNVIFSNIWVFMIVATIVFTIVSILGGHYIHRKRQFRLEQALSIEENPYLYKAAPGKERDLAIPMGILQLDALEELLRSNNALTEEKKKQFETYRQGLIKLKDGQSLRRTSK
jgi:cbb3-type cytochrome oxidase subunit 3